MKFKYKGMKITASSKENAMVVASIIKNLEDIDMDSECGKLLLMGLAKITSESQKNKTPQEVLDQLNALRNEVYGTPKDTKLGI